GRVMLAGKRLRDIGERKDTIDLRSEAAVTHTLEACREGGGDIGARGGVHPVAQPEEGEGDVLARADQDRIELRPAERAILDEGTTGLERMTQKRIRRLATHRIENGIKAQGRDRLGLHDDLAPEYSGKPRGRRIAANDRD